MKTAIYYVFTLVNSVLAANVSHHVQLPKCDKCLILRKIVNVVLVKSIMKKKAYLDCVQTSHF